MVITVFIDPTIHVKRVWILKIMVPTVFQFIIGYYVLQFIICMVTNHLYGDKKEDESAMLVTSMLGLG